MNKKGNSEDSLFFSNCKLGLWDRKPLDASHGLLGWASGSFWRPFGRVPGFLEGLFVPPGRLRESPKASWGGCFRASGGHFWVSWGPRQALWGTLEASWGPLEPGGWNCGFAFPLLGGFSGHLGAPLGCLGALLGRLGALLARPGTVLGVSWAGLELSWGSLRPSWSAGSSKTRESQKPRKNNENQLLFHHRALSGRLSELSSGLLEASW